MTPCSLKAGLAYKESLRENRCPALHFALPDAWSSQTAYNQYLAMEDLFFTAIQEMVKSPSDEALTGQWRQLQQKLSAQGLDALESVMTTRFLEALDRYQAAGLCYADYPAQGLIDDPQDHLYSLQPGSSAPCRPDGAGRLLFSCSCRHLFPLHSA